MKIAVAALCLILTTTLLHAQIDFKTPFKECQLEGSISIYDYQNKKWHLSNAVDAYQETLPASTFKIINLLIALETKVIKDENVVVKWVGHTDTTLYGYRPDIYHDMTVKEAFEVSAGWVFIELAKKIGKERYKAFLKAAQYSNLNLSQKGDDFWNFGSFGISPMEQVKFLMRVYEEKVPFSKRNIEILKRVMVVEQKGNYTIRAKTGWTRYGDKDTGWWVGYVERKNNVYFFATRLIKDLKTPNPRFGQCRKDITKAILTQLKAFE
ncbi:penicillin-binding transpeptidase domain-containing protein [Runella sp. MFBS21]|uniref:penicillin-binding transpeptidase domain-containing protein n=1 Tax=Runella sp. MFBS21 TaxID=3034018 RepID=UPI0023F8466F|nr:penicillin-binding transpeptidase domain-containing protein [Runella sp. MFBS21]MDF7818723.1 penicillin-binding transpeptidase domain-containing protein [Runella sp. MFBS21]